MQGSPYQHLQPDFNAIVVGGGLVGAACALALSADGLAVALLESRAQPVAVMSDELDGRIYAISPGSADWLHSLGVWQLLDQNRLCPLADMQIYGDSPGAQLRLSAYDGHVDKLGFIVENSQLEQALWQRLQQSDVQLRFEQRPQAVDWQRACTQLTLQDGSSLQAGLLVAADGGHSWLREQAAIALHSHDYAQTAVVANFSSELVHGDTARQWFVKDGVLAWLPLPRQHLSMVWSTSHENAARLLRLAPAELAEEVAAAGGHALGGLRLLNEARAFPLHRQTAGNLVKPRLALVGDAAHVIHPLAGQGVNLGFRDVMALSDTIASRKPMQDIGDFMLLRRYERQRKADLAAMRHLTHGLQSLFANPRPAVARLRNWGLQLTQRQTRLKKHLIKRAVI